MDNMKHRRLQELDRSDFEITKGEPDIRGWDVRNSSGQKIGEVEELIIDAQQKKVRYMVVELDNDEVDLEDDKDVLIPIGLAELHKDNDDVLLPNISMEQLKALPSYDRNNLDEEAEKNICSILGRKLIPLTTSANTATGEQSGTTATPAQQETDFYQHNYFDIDNLYKHRLHEATPVTGEPKKETEYEHGLKLWELRSEGGTLGSGAARQTEDKEFEEKRLEMVRNRRKAYEDRRGGYNRDERNRDEHHSQKHNTIIDRIKNEGLRDA